MARLTLLPLTILLSACTAPAPDDATPAPVTSLPESDTVQPVGESPTAEASNPVEALRNRWEVLRLDNLAFPAKQGFVHFQNEGFFSHEAGCGGGHPAFFEAEADGTIRTSRRERVVIGKCPDRAAAARERALADFIDDLSSWEMPDASTLVLKSNDGRTAQLRLPVGPIPEIEGDWRVVSIAGEPWVGPGPAKVSISFNWFGAAAGCNGGGAEWSSPAPGKLRIGSFAATQMLCNDALMRADGLLFGAVSGVTGYRFAGDRLILTGPREIVLER